MRVRRGHSQAGEEQVWRREAVEDRVTELQSQLTVVCCHWPWLASWHSSAYFHSVLEDVACACLMLPWCPDKGQMYL